MDTYFRAALRLHDYLVAHHWRDDALVGPDPGVRFNYRIYRFAKSALRAVPWQDDLYYLQGQGYWVLANWRLAALTGDTSYLDRCAGLINFMRAVQKPSGEFPYAVEGEDGGAYKGHFQCYQYNAFQCLDLMRYHDLTNDAAALPLIDDALDFLRSGI